MDLSRLSRTQVCRLAFLAGEEATLAEDNHDWRQAEECCDMAMTLWAAVGNPSMAAGYEERRNRNALAAMAEHDEIEADAAEEVFA